MKIFTQTKQHREIERGFTLIETLVAISILLISTAGPLTFAQSGLRASFLARDQVAAFYLAQDAIETIKNLRDKQGLKNTKPWLGFLGSCVSGTVRTTVACNIDTRATNIPDPTLCADTCFPMKYNATDKQFELTGPVNSKYTRTIYVTEVSKDKEAQIVVKVDWTSNYFAEKSIVVQENIYNWVPQFKSI